MTTYTTRKKGWWKVWLLIGLIAAVIAVVAILALLGFIDLAPAEAGYLSIFMWGSDSIVNAFLLTIGFIALGLIGGYLWYNYLRGQQTKTAATAGVGYNPIPTTPSNPQQDTETVIS